MDEGATTFGGGGKATPRSQERSRGALLGLAVGDALGATLEFAEPRAPAFPSRAGGPHTEIVGGGPFRLVPGQVTDDTHMACCLAEGLASARGRYDAADVARRYAAWQELAFDIGAQTSAALNAIREGVPPARAGREVWVRSARRPAGNGSLMRTAPIGVFLADDPTARRAASLADSAITHADPRCRLACAAFDAAVAAAVLGASSPAELREAARAELLPAAAILRAEGEDGAACSAALLELGEDLDLSSQDDPRLYEPPAHLHRNRGFVRVAFRLAFWELQHAPSFRDALLDVVNRGGDADTNGAIAGALAGALHGVDAIPEAWRRRVLEAVPPGPAPLRDAYHPAALVGALQRAIGP